jgi:prevent-host-death family protein
MPQTVNFREFRENLSTFLRQAQEGAEFIVTSRGKTLARIGPPDALKPRPMGLLKGQIRMAPDFDETPADLIAAMEGDEP